jgi:hypothetical protein
MQNFKQYDREHSEIGADFFVFAYILKIGESIAGKFPLRQLARGGTFVHSYGSEGDLSFCLSMDIYSQRI